MTKRHDRRQGIGLCAPTGYGADKPPLEAQLLQAVRFDPNVCIGELDQAHPLDVVDRHFALLVR